MVQIREEQLGNITVLDKNQTGEIDASESTITTVKGVINTVQGSAPGNNSFWVQTGSPSLPKFTNSAGSTITLDANVVPTLAAVLAQGQQTDGLSITLNDESVILGEVSNGWMMHSGGTFRLVSGTAGSGEGAIHFYVNNDAEDKSFNVWLPQAEDGSTATFYGAHEEPLFSVYSGGTNWPDVGGITIGEPGLSGEQARVSVSSTSPVGLLTGSPGDLCITSELNQSKLYQHRGGAPGVSDWVEVGSSTSPPPMSIFSSDRPTGRTRAATLDSVPSVGGSTITILNYTGGEPGYVSYLFVAGNRQVFENGTIQIYVDGEVVPSISVPMLRFFVMQAQTSVAGAPFGSRILGFNATGANYSTYFNLPIPFSSGIRIDLVLGAQTGTPPLWAQATYHTGVPNTWARTRKLHVSSIHQTGIASYAETDIVPLAIGRGRLAALWIMGDGGPGSQTPAGAWMEGPVKLYLDGELAIESPGTEDYFGLGFYGGGISRNWMSNPEQGVVFRNGNNAVGFLRSHIDSPICFNEDFRLSWTNGQLSNIPITGGTGTVFATCWWYSEGEVDPTGSELLTEDGNTLTTEDDIPLILEQT